MTISPKEPYCPERDGLLDCENCEFRETDCKLDGIDQRIQKIEFALEYFDLPSSQVEDLKEEKNYLCEQYESLVKLIEEIKEKAKTACQVSQGTTTQEIACTVKRETQKWEIGNQEEMSWYVNNLVRMLKSRIPHNTENKEILDMIDNLKFENNLTKQYIILSNVIILIPTVNVVAIEHIVENINKVSQELGTKLDGLSQEMKYIRISFKHGIKQDIEISSGIEILGTGAKLITTIPLQEISYAELKEDLQSVSMESISKLSKLPKRLANKIKGYLLMKDREDIIERLT